MLSRGETDNTKKTTKLKAILPITALKKIVVKPELSHGDIKFNDLFFASLFRPK
jgi:hypothetical protein